MNKLKKPVNGAFFWAGIVVITYLSCLLILITHDLILIKGVAAAEVSSAIVYHPTRANSEAIDGQANLQNKSDSDFVNCDCEKEFASPLAVTWRGRVIGTFSSGEGIGVKKYNFDDEYSMFYVATNNLYDGKATEVEVQGDLTGITCAYANTSFGECVPLVQATRIKDINIQ